MSDSKHENNTNNENSTHFGYKTVDKNEKAGKVAEVFHSVAAKYDIMNDLMSAGVHRIWKQFTIEASVARRGHKILDIAGGTGDLAAKFSKIVGPQGQVILSDINNSMLNVGRDKLTDRGISGNIEYVQANAECLPFPDNYFDCITIAFGLRNVTDKPAALAEMQRVTRPGGRALDATWAESDHDTHVMPHVRDTCADALGRAGLDTVDDLGAVEVHDCFTSSAYLAIDHLGITAPGDSWKAIESGEIERDGRIPVNPGGGLIGGGHPVGATGVRMVVDAARQVTGRAGDVQIPGVTKVGTLNIGGSAATTCSLIVEGAPV